MSFDAFEQTIKSPALKQIASYWHQVCDGRPMPRWEDIRPSKLACHLSIIWSYRYDRANDALVGRLAGDKIEQMFGKTFRGAPMTALYPPDQYPAMFERFRRIVTGPSLLLEMGMVFKSVDAYGYGERIAMPTSSDGTVADGILGATVYEAFQAVQVSADPDVVTWFPLSMPQKETAPE